MDTKLRDAMGGKAARACDYCIRRRARWYCAADDAFLCQACDSSVHSANPLARRHARVQLKATLSLNAAASHEPSWHRGFTRKARTPRHGKYNSKPKTDAAPLVKNPLHLVPEMCSDENSHDENEDQLLYRVPIFDPFVADLCTNITDTAVNESKCAAGHNNWEGKSSNMPTEMELAEFAADVESLLGKGLDEESFDMEGLGFLGGNSEEKASSTMECCLGFSHEKVKVEEDAAEVLMANDHSFDTLELKFDYDDSPNIDLELEDNEKEELSTMDEENGSTIMRKKKTTILLNLDYEGVILAWSDQRSPWTTGERPELNSDDGWPDCMQRGCGTIHPYGVGDMGITCGGQGAMADGGREARVSRYREKRRTRLFSKKIRYEVRKLNAEKRPRMKGRFVKRANFPAALAFPLLNK